MTHTYKIFFPDADSCKWLECIKKGYQVNNGFCYSHKNRGKELGNKKQCSFYNKEGLCLIATDKQFNKRFYCDNHHKLIIEYDKEVQEQVKILEEESKKEKVIELVGVLEKYVDRSRDSFLNG